MHSKTENTNTTGSKETQQKDSSSQMSFLTLFGISPEQQRLLERERANDEAAEQRLIQNRQAFQCAPGKWKKISIEAFDHHVNFDRIHPEILHQDKWVVERKGYSTSIDVPEKEYDKIIEALQSYQQTIFKVNGQWLNSVLYPGLESGGACFTHAS